MTGIIAKYAGTCPGCKGRYEKGDQIDRIPGFGDQRGHLDCANGVAGVAGGGAPRGGRDHGDERRPRDAAPSTNGQGALGTVLSTTLEAIRTGLQQAVEANRDAADALDRERAAMENVLRAIELALPQRPLSSSRR